jgi:mannosyltransferase OCH1-like enzyme
MQKCVDSWVKHCQGYEIIEWNESNFDINSNLYCRQAYDNKKYAFASDYIRFAVLYEHGGIYLDTDVELLRPFDDLLDKPAFICYEDERFFAFATIGAVKNNPWIKQMLDFYHRSIFLQENGSFDLSSINVLLTPLTKFLYPEIMLNGKNQCIRDVFIFSKYYFIAYDIHRKKLIIKDYTYSIHHYAESWNKTNLKTKMKRWVKRLCVTFPLINNLFFYLYKKRQDKIISDMCESLKDS